MEILFWLVIGLIVGLIALLAGAAYFFSARPMPMVGRGGKNAADGPEFRRQQRK